MIHCMINNAVPSHMAKISKQFLSNESEQCEDVELLLKDLMNRKDLEETKMFQNEDHDYESLGNLRKIRMRDSIESPVFGSKVDDFQSQRNLLNGVNLAGKDELEGVFPKRQTNNMFKKNKRHFSFVESELSSLPSSEIISNKRRESLNSKATSNYSDKTPNFRVLKAQRISESSGMSKSRYFNPSNNKSNLESISESVGANKNMLSLPPDSSPVIIHLLTIIIAT
jgi:hypothetical protein